MIAQAMEVSISNALSLHAAPVSCCRRYSAKMSEERERERERSPERSSEFKVFVGGISWHTTEAELKDSTVLIPTVLMQCLPLYRDEASGARAPFRVGKILTTAAAFSKYARGPVDAQIMVDKLTGRSRGFGFAMFDTKEDMDECIAKLHGTELEGRKISVTKAIPQSEIAPGAPASAYHRGGRDR
jgi:heterogeneous nuclear ribonucleoprotein G